MATSTAAPRAFTRARGAMNPATMLIGLIVLGAALRFWRIGHQSFWLDEAYTVNLVRHSFGGMLSTIPHTESTPPLYYMLAWVWARIFGTGEAGLRSLSAVFGTATIPVAYVAAQRLFDRRSALVAATLVAVNPYFVWYSQEARAYALLVLLATASLLAFAHVLRQRTARAGYVWAAVAVAALVTHYFAVFLVLPEAVWLLYATRARWMAAAVALPIAAAGVLAPLALAQRGTAHAQWIGNLSFRRRFLDLPKKFVTGELGLPLPALGTLAGLVVFAAVVWALSRTHWRATTALMVGLTLAVVAVPLLLAAAGADYVIGRNLIVMYVPLAFATAAGLAAGGRLGGAGLAFVCAVAVLVTGYVAYDSKVQRDDWRGLAAALGPVTGPRAIVLGPAVNKPAFALYAGATHQPPLGPMTVGEVDAVLDTRPPRAPAPPPPPGFTLTAIRHTSSWQLVRYRAPQPVVLTTPQLLAVKLGSEPPGLFVQGFVP